MEGERTPTAALRCLFCQMAEARVTELDVDLRVTLKADVKSVLYAEARIPTCVKHDHIYIIHTRVNA